MSLRKIMCWLFLSIIACKIFTFDGGYRSETEKQVNEWLKDKRFISAYQSSAKVYRDNQDKTETTLTIFARLYD